MMGRSVEVEVDVDTAGFSTYRPGRVRFCTGRPGCSWAVLPEAALVVGRIPADWAASARRDLPGLGVDVF